MYRANQNAQPKPDSMIECRPAGKDLLTVDEELTLARAWKLSGDTEARNMLVERNLGLVHSIARGFDGRGIPRAELFAEGCLGLVRAACNFDPEAGTRFSTFAYQHVRHAIGTLFSSRSSISRTPRSIRQQVNRWREAESSLAVSLGRTPTDLEVADSLGWAESDVCRARCAHASAMRLTAMSSLEHENVSPGVADSQPEHAEDTHLKLERLLSQLSERERLAIELTYGIGNSEQMSRDAIAEVMGCTKDVVRQLQQHAEYKLRRRARLMTASFEQAAAARSA